MRARLRTSREPSLESDLAPWELVVNRLPNLTPDRRPILTLLNDGFGR